MKTVLVTGVSGYVGRHVVDALHSLGVRVIGIDVHRMSEDQCDRFIKANIMEPSFDLMDELGFIPDACLHLAWRNGFDHNSVSHMLDLSGHFSFLAQTVDSGIPLVACMGSMHEVGYWEGVVDEHTPCNPQSYYGIAKDALRRSFLLKATSANVRAQWLRGFCIYGDDEGSQSIFGKLFRASAEGKRSFPFTSGTNRYDFLPVQEFAHQIASCILCPDAYGIINCCSGHPLSLAEKVESYIKEKHLDITLEYGAYPDRPYDSPAIWGDNAKVAAVLGSKGD